MRRTTLILSAIAVATLGLVLFILLGPDDELETNPGDSGMTSISSSAEEAKAADSDAAESEGEEEAATRTELATIDDTESQASQVEGNGSALTLQVVDPERQPIEGLVAKVLEGGPLNDGSLFMPGYGERPEQEVLSEIASNANGEIELTGIPANTEITLLLGGDYWVEREIKVAPLRSEERRNLGELPLARGVLLTGRVVDEASRGIEGSKIALQERSSNQMPGGVMIAGMGGNGLRREVQTDADGYFRMPGLPPKEYTLSAEKAGRVKTETELLLSLSNPNHRVQLNASKGGTVRGVVRAEDGTPLPNARVALVPASGFARYQWPQERIMEEGMPVSEDGSFQLGGVPDSNSHRVVAAAPDFARGRSERVVPGMKLELNLSPRVVLAGIVLDAADQPVAGATINARPAVVEGGDPSVQFQFDTTASDDEGRFTFDSLSTGTYNLDVVSPAGTAKREGVVVGASNPEVTLKLDGGEAMIVRVTDEDGQAVPEARVQVTRVIPQSANDIVTEDGRSVRITRAVSADGEIMSLDGPESRRFGKTDEAGLIRFLGLPKAEYRVAVTKDGYARTVEMVERATEDEQLVVVPLPKAASVRILAVDSGGTPIPDANLELTRIGAEPAESHSARTDAWGLVVFDGLTPGEYSVREESSNAGNGGMVFRGWDTEELEETEPEPQDEIVRFALESGELGEQQIVLAAKAIPTVLVTRMGIPVANASVQLEESSGNEQMMVFAGFGDFGGGGGAVTNAQGLATLPPNNPGDFLLKARASATNPFTTKKVQIGPGAQQLTIELATGEVSGSVVGPGGAVVGARVSLTRAQDEGGTTRSRSIGVVSIAIAGDDDEAELETIDFSSADARTTTDSDGRFRFVDVPAGFYTISVKAKGHQPLEIPSFAVEEGTQADRGVLSMEAGASLKGSILNLPTGASDYPRYFMVQLMDMDGATVGFNSVRSNGSYSFEDIEPGTYQLSIQLGDGEERVSGSISVAAGAPTTFDFAL